MKNNIYYNNYNIYLKYKMTITDLLKNNLNNDYTKYKCNNLYLTFNNNEIIYNKKCKLYKENNNEYRCCGYNIIKKNNNIEDYIYERCNNKIKEGHVCNKHMNYKIEHGFIDKNEFKITLNYNVNKNIILINICDYNNIFICKGIIQLTTELESLCRFINIISMSIYGMIIPDKKIDILNLTSITIRDSYFFMELMKKVEIIYLVYKEIVRKEMNNILIDNLYKDIIDEIVNNIYVDMDRKFSIVTVEYGILIYRNIKIMNSKNKIKYILNMVNHFYKHYRYMCLNNKSFLLLMIKKLEEASEKISKKELNTYRDKEEKEEYIKINNEIENMIEELYKKVDSKLIINF